MAKIKLITDSASDISKENAEKYDILVIPFKVTIGEKSYVSRVDFDNEGFYKMLDEYDGIPMTSQITAFEFTEVFEKLYEEGYTDAIYTSINAKGSSTYSNSLMASESPRQRESLLSTASTEDPIQAATAMLLLRVLKKLRRTLPLTRSWRL